MTPRGIGRRDAMHRLQSGFAGSCLERSPEVPISELNRMGTSSWTTLTSGTSTTSCSRDAHRNCVPKPSGRDSSDWFQIAAAWRNRWLLRSGLHGAQGRSLNPEFGLPGLKAKPGTEPSYAKEIGSDFLRNCRRNGGRTATRNGGYPACGTRPGRGNDRHNGEPNDRLGDGEQSGSAAAGSAIPMIPTFCGRPPKATVALRCCWRSTRITAEIAVMGAARTAPECTPLRSFREGVGQRHLAPLGNTKFDGCYTPGIASLTVRFISNFVTSPGTP